MFRLALKSIRHNPKRLILTIFAAVLGVALVASTHVLTQSISNGLNGQIGAIAGEIDIVVSPSQDDDDDAGPGADLEQPVVGNPLDDEDIAAMARVPGVDSVITQTYAFGAYLDDEGLPRQEGFAATGIFLNWLDIPVLDNATVADGSAPAAAGEVMIDQGYATGQGIAIGDRIDVATADSKMTLTVVGLGESSQQTFGSALSWTTLETANAINGGGTGYSSAFIIVDEGANVDQVLAGVTDVLPSGARALTSTEFAEEASSDVADVLRYVDIFSLAFAFISVFVGGYIIVNTFLIIVAQRTREIGLLRALGATERQVRAQVLLEATVIGVLSTAIGLGLGYLLAVVLGLIGGQLTGPGVFSGMTLPLDAILWGAAVGIGVVVGSAYVPAVHASRISPMEALRESATNIRKPLKVRNIVAGVFVAVAATCLVVGLNGLGKPPWAWVAAGAVAMVLGVTLFAPQVLGPLAGLLRRPMVAMFGLNGKLATRNIQREPRRSATSASALMIGVLLLSLTATVAESARAQVTAEVAGFIKADFFVGPNFEPRPIEADIPGEISQIDGVELAIPLGGLDVALDGDEYQAVVVESAEFARTYTVRAEPAIDQVGDGIYVSESLAEDGYQVGDVVTLTSPDTTLDLEIRGILFDEIGGAILMDWDTAELLGDDTVLFEVDIVAADGADLEKLGEDIDTFLAENYPLFIKFSVDEFVALANTIVDIVLIGITLLLSASLFIAVLGIANTLLLSVNERTHEIGLLRAVGVKRRGIWAMITLESVVMSLFGTAMGMILGVGLAAAIITSLEDQGFTELAIPWVWMGIYTVLAIIAGVLAAVWPARRASKLNILDAIATE